MVVLPLPQPRRPSPGAAAPTDPRSGRGGGTEAQEAEQEASRQPRFPEEATGGVAQPAGPRSRRRLDGVSARRGPLGSSPERSPRLPSPPLCLGLRRQREPGTDGVLGGAA